MLTEASACDKIKPSRHPSSGQGEGSPNVAATARNCTSNIDIKSQYHEEATPYNEVWQDLMKMTTDLGR